MEEASGIDDIDGSDKGEESDDRRAAMPVTPQSGDEASGADNMDDFDNGEGSDDLQAAAGATSYGVDAEVGVPLMGNSIGRHVASVGRASKRLL